MVLLFAFCFLLLLLLFAFCVLPYAFCLWHFHWAKEKKGFKNMGGWNLGSIQNQLYMNGDMES